MPTSKLPDLINEIITNKGKNQARGKDAKEIGEEELINNDDEAGRVKKRITLFENKFCKI